MMNGLVCIYIYIYIYVCIAQSAGAVQYTAAPLKRGKTRTPMSILDTNYLKVRFQ